MLTLGSLSLGSSWKEAESQQLLLFQDWLGGLGGKGIYLQHRYFETKKIVLYTRRAMITFLPQDHLPSSCWTQLYVPQCAKPSASFRPFHTQESTYLNDVNRKLPELRSPGCRFGVFLVLTLTSRVLFFFLFCFVFLPVFVCKMNSICYYRKSYTKHYIVSF